jgi:hypothetical protein
LSLNLDDFDFSDEISCDMGTPEAVVDVCIYSRTCRAAAITPMNVEIALRQQFPKTTKKPGARFKRMLGWRAS